MGPLTILLATTNGGKLREVAAVLADLPVRLATLDDFPSLPEPQEDGDTFEANALLKARHYARLSGVWALADDSGLEVDALGGAPGVVSARYAGCDAPAREDRDAANNARLLSELRNTPIEKRTARFRCALALCDGDRLVATAIGAVEGLIIDDARGDNGFGYDPHFLIPEFGLTTAEMPPDQKNRISHRGRALAALRIAMAQGGVLAPYSA
jgi:XTP/dITP diphosphohydrolase